MKWHDLLCPRSRPLFISFKWTVKKKLPLYYICDLQKKWQHCYTGLSPLFLETTKVKTPLFICDISAPPYFKKKMPRKCSSIALYEVPLKLHFLFQKFYSESYCDYLNLKKLQNIGNLRLKYLPPKIWGKGEHNS